MGPILQNGLSFGQPQIRSLLLDSCVTLFAFDTARYRYRCCRSTHPLPAFLCYVQQCRAVVEVDS